jgi:hypothetical protein
MTTDGANASLILLDDLDRIAMARLADAEALARAGRFDGAVYVCGYAVEVALKARICRTLNWVGFPASSSEFHGLHSFRTHDLLTLLRLSGRKTDIVPTYNTVWEPLEEWRPELRYRPVGSTTAHDAQNMIACTAKLLEIL